MTTVRQLIEEPIKQKFFICLINQLSNHYHQLPWRRLASEWFFFYIFHSFIWFSPWNKTGFFRKERVNSLFTLTFIDFTLQLSRQRFFTIVFLLQVLSLLWKLLITVNDFQHSFFDRTYPCPDQKPESHWIYFLKLLKGFL